MKKKKIIIILYGTFKIKIIKEACYTCNSVAIYKTRLKKVQKHPH